MLEFIVLGQIPGTTYQLDFTQIALVALGFMALVVAAHQFKYLLHRSIQLRSDIESKAI